MKSARLPWAFVVARWLLWAGLMWAVIVVAGWLATDTSLLWRALLVGVVASLAARPVQRLAEKLTTPRQPPATPRREWGL